MFLGRACGWALVALALLLASGDAVLALGPGEYPGLATADILTILAGHVPHPNAIGSHSLAVLGTVIMAMPAWAVLGPLGAIIAYLCRQRPRSRRLFNRAA
ncbi:MAG: hypothetical protein HQL41_11730 [Alphaproteobacteria bacterium]|nr:hypothetical protein [Alphaproteobacteria bacterium]